MTLLTQLGFHHEQYARGYLVDARQSQGCVDGLPVDTQRRLGDGWAMQAFLRA